MSHTTTILLQQASEAMETITLLLTKRQSERLMSLLEHAADSHTPHSTQARLEVERDKELVRYVEQAFASQAERTPAEHSLPQTPQEWARVLAKPTEPPAKPDPSEDAERFPAD